MKLIDYDVNNKEMGEKFTIASVLENIDKYMDEELKVQSIPEPKKREELLNMGNFSECSNNELGELLSFYGAFLSYISIRLSKIDSKRGIIKSSIEESNSKAMYLLQNESDEKRKTKEVLNGEILVKYPQIKKMKQDLIETEAIYIRIKALFDSYQILWNTVSRIIAIRTAEIRNI